MGPQVILVHSFKGGTGKTLLSINLADFLRNRGNKVLLLESDFIMPAFTSIFDKYQPDIFFNDFLNSSDTKLDRYIYPSPDADLGIIFADTRYRVQDKINSSDQNWFRSKKNQLEKALSQSSYDFVIFDGQPSVHLFTINTIVISDHIIVVLRPDIQSINGTKTLLDNIYSRSYNMKSRSTPTFNLVFNQLPNVDKIENLIEKWIMDFTMNYDFISKTAEIYYNDETAFSTARMNFVLGEDDPTKINLSKSFSYLLNHT